MSGHVTRGSNSWRVAWALAFAAAAAVCSGRGERSTPEADKSAQASSLPTVDVVQIVERSIDVPLEMPGESHLFETGGRRFEGHRLRQDDSGRPRIAPSRRRADR